MVEESKRKGDRRWSPKVAGIRKSADEGRLMRKLCLGRHSGERGRPTLVRMTFLKVGVSAAGRPLKERKKSVETVETVDERSRAYVKQQ